LARRVRGQLIDGLLEHLPEASLGIDRSGRIRFLNRAAGSLLEVDSEAVLDQEVWEALPVTEFSRYLGQLVKSGANTRREQIFGFSEGHVCAVQVVPVDSDDGRLQGWVLYLRDMTAVQKIEKGLEQFLTDINRELKLPLTSIKGYVETLLEGAYQSPEVTKRFLQIINEETNRLARLVISLEEASTPKAAQEPLWETSLTDMLKEVAAVFGASAAEKGIDLIVELPGFVPKFPLRAGTLRKALTNLVDNALKSCGLHESGQVKIELELRRDCTLIHIKDNGVGIAPEFHSQIFEKFFRVKTGPLAELGGTGLGLAVAREAVQDNQGTLTLQSDINQGAVFTITLPVH
jgi:two-component system, OmpR family, phosphate regulon sensor histidine kinase PhoR